MHGIDVETTALLPAEGDLRLVQLSDGRRVTVYDAFRQDKDLIRRAVEEYDELVAHNAPFERKWLKAALDLDRPDLHDTMVMSQVLYTGTNAAKNKQFSHSLQTVMKRETKRELDKSEQNSEWGAQELSEEQIHYAAMDAHVLPELADTLLQRIDKFGLREVYELKRRVSHAVDQMERNGFGIDLVCLDAFIAESTEQAERLKAELEEEWKINPGSSKQLREHFNLEAREGWPTTPGGSPSTNQQAMALLADEVPEISKRL